MTLPISFHPCPELQGLLKGTDSDTRARAAALRQAELDEAAKAGALYRARDLVINDFALDAQSIAPRAGESTKDTDTRRTSARRCKEAVAEAIRHSTPCLEILPAHALDPLLIREQALRLRFHIVRAERLYSDALLEPARAAWRAYVNVFRATDPQAWSQALKAAQVCLDRYERLASSIGRNP